MSPQEQQSLLELARATMAARLSGRRSEAPEASAPGSPSFGGLFVSLHRGRQLRGCIGTFSPRGDLEQTVREMSLAVLTDSRFVKDPVTAAELPELHIEISVLSASVPTKDPLSLEVGRHGVIVEREGRSGCFLPQVGSQQGWSAKRLLTECCTQKAHLPADAWKDPRTQVLLFTAEVFGEPAASS